MRTRAIWDADERAEVVKEYNRGIWREKYHGGRNWVLRDGTVAERAGLDGGSAVGADGSGDGSAERHTNPTPDTASDSTSDATSNSGADPPSTSWRDMFKAQSRDMKLPASFPFAGMTTTTNNNNNNNSNNKNSTGTGSTGNINNIRSSEDIWPLRTEPVARAFDLHPAHHLDRIAIDEETGQRVRVEDLGGENVPSNMKLLGDKVMEELAAARGGVSVDSSRDEEEKVAEEK